MKKLLALMLILLVGLFAGCITDSDDDGDDDGDNGGGGASGGTAAEYFPISSGGTWTFEETEEYDGSTYTDTYVMTTSGTETINGKTYTVLGGTDGEEMYFRIENNIIYMYDPYMDYIGKESPAKTAIIEKINAQEMPWMNFGVGKGNSWTIYEHSEQHEGYSYSVSNKGKYIGTESVTVPAGTYKDCMKFQMTMQWSSSGGGEQWSETDIETFWFAKGVGPVKIESVEKEGNTVYYKTTTKLKSYVKGGSVGDDDDNGDDDDDNGSGGDDDDNGGSGGAAGTHAFFPLKTGAFWQYSETEKNFFNDYEETTTSTFAISGTKVLDGKSYWIATTDGEEDGYLRVSNGILYSYMLEDMMEKAVGKTIPAALKQAVENADPFDEELPLINLNAGVGQEWEILSYTLSEEGYTMTMTWTGVLTGNDNITVPAGTFNNCREYETTLVTTSTYSNISTSSTMTETFWLAQNVGMVKILTKDTMDNQPYFETDEQLTGYSIP